MWHWTHQHPWRPLDWCVSYHNKLSPSVDIHIWNKDQDYDWQETELGICQRMAMTINSPFLSPCRLHPSFHPTLLFYLPPSLSVSVLVSYLCPVFFFFFSWFRASICLRWFPCGAMKWDREGEKISLKEGIICCQLPAPAEHGHRENTNDQKDPPVIWSAAMLHTVLCQLHIGRCSLINKND